MSGANTPGAFNWSSEAIDHLRQRRGEGLSNGQIAKELAKKFKAPVSRSAVIGKAWRLGLEMSDQRREVTMRLAQPPKKPKEILAKERVSKDAIAERRVVDLIRVEKVRATAPLPLNDPDAIAAAPCCLMALRTASCRWPLNRVAPDGETLFCNNDKLEAGVYCDGHARRAYASTPESREAYRKRRLADEQGWDTKGRGMSSPGYGLARRA